MSARLHRAPALLAVTAIALTALIAAPAAASAVEYPSWDDVTQARSSQAAQQAEVDRVTTALDALESDLARSQQEAAAANERYQESYRLAQEAEEALLGLEAELSEAESTAANSGSRADELVLGIARSGPLSPSLQALATPDDTTGTLYRLGVMARLTDQSEAVVTEAQLAANQVSSLADQADVAGAELLERSAAAETEFAAAETAAEAANAAVLAQDAQRITLEEQLAFLTSETASVESDYAAGVRAAQEAAERRAREAAQAARNNSGVPPAAGGSPATGGSGGSYYAPSSSGWWRPVPGPVTSLYGPRRIICNGYGCTVPFHGGVDMADPCGRPIKAANAGTVVSAKNDGSFGYRVIIDHGGGTRTYYGHMRAGSFTVSAGQQVSGGQTLGEVGDTGVVTGCHIDVKVDDGGNQTNPSNFFANRGVTL